MQCAPVFEVSSRRSLKSICAHSSMKAACIAALLLLGAVCAWAGNEDEYDNEATAMGGADYDKDSSTQISLHTKTLTLNFPSRDAGNLILSTVGGNTEEAGSTALFQYNIVCGEGEYAEVIGNCAETGIYLAHQSYSYARQQVNWQISCEITKKCAGLNNLVGSFNGVSRSLAGTWAKSEFPITLALTGGTGDFSHVIGGSITFYYDNYAKAKFLYWTKSKPYYN